MADKLTETEEIQKEIVDKRIESSVTQSRMAVLQSENKRLRDKFNEITKQSRQMKLEMQATIDMNEEQLEKKQHELEASEGRYAKL